MKLDCASKCYFPFVTKKSLKQVAFINGFLENENRCEHFFCEYVLKMKKNYMLRSYQVKNSKICNNKGKINNVDSCFSWKHSSLLILLALRSHFMVSNDS